MTLVGESHLEALESLARHHGVATTYVDGTGKERRPSTTTVMAILRALGVPIDRVADASSALADLPPRPTTPAPAETAPLDRVRCASGPQRPRSWGVFSPLSALRRSDVADHGLGDLTGLAELAEVVRDLGGSVTATLPLVATRPDEPSPYSPLTRQFFDERWVDPAWVAARLGVATAPARSTVGGERSHPEAAWSSTRAALAALVPVGSRLPDEIVAWRRARPEVETWARFKAAAVAFGWDPSLWTESLDRAVRTHDDRALAGLGVTDAAIDFEIVAQWAVATQLEELSDRERALGSALYLDLPVGCSSTSFDVWASPGEFAAGVTIGAPPDSFFPDGQSWGLRPVHPVVAAADGHGYLRRCVEAHMRVCGLLRIDHVMGLHRLFWVPDDAEPGEGTYVAYGAEEQWAVIAELSDRYGVGVVGEDLGTVPDETRSAMAEWGARGLFIGQDEVRSPFRLSRPVPSATVASLNTHDLPPVAAWRAADRDQPVPALPVESSAATIRDHLVGELARSGADVMLVSDQDLVLDERRFNVPGTVGGDVWRLRSRLTVDALRSGSGIGAEARRVAANTDVWRRTPSGHWPNDDSKWIDSADVQSLQHGTHACLGDRFGFHPTSVCGVVGAAAGVWAPNARSVVVSGDFDGWTGTSLHRFEGSSVWEGFVASAMLGDRYKIRIEGPDGQWVDKSDPFARSCELPPGNASILTASDPTHRTWSDAEWMANRSALHSIGNAMSIYELHLGSWRHHPDGRVPTYREITPWLIDYVASMGFTHIELMPVMEHPFGGSWGYHVSGYFAPTSRYGSPEDFAWMIDQLHGAGIGVILDWVPAHFPDDVHGLADFDGGPQFEYSDPREGRHPEWGSRVFDWGRPEVRAFLVSSARWWLERFHIDGLRVDAVASMLYRSYARADGEWTPNVHGGAENLEAVDFVRQVTTEIHASVPGAMVMAEESTSWPGVTHPVSAGGLGFDLKWDLGWMHDMLEYLGRDPVHRRWHQDELTFRAMYSSSERFILPLSHDEVVHGKGSLVNKMAGDDWQRRANLRALFGHQYTVPGVPLVFMGGELAMNEEWNHNAALPWYLLDHAPHEGVRSWLAELNRVMRSTPALYAADHRSDGFAWIDCADRDNSVLAWLRRTGTVDGGGDIVIVLANFTPATHEGYRVGLPVPGRWRCIANSDDHRWGGSGYPLPEWLESEPIPIGEWSQSALVTLTPLALSIYHLEPS